MGKPRHNPLRQVVWFISVEQPSAPDRWWWGPAWGLSCGWNHRSRGSHCSMVSLFLSQYHQVGCWGDGELSSEIPKRPGGWAGECVKLLGESLPEASSGTCVLLQSCYLNLPIPLNGVSHFTVAKVPLSHCSPSVEATLVPSTAWPSCHIPARRSGLMLLRHPEIELI